MPPRMRRRITSAKREQIEKEEKALSKSIVRPFDVVAGLPVSYSQPPYGNYEDVLKTPLTVKDSGILYRSLMKSRTNYVGSCPMFRLYWIKQTSYAKKLMGENRLVKTEADRAPVLSADVNARDVMVKLCDAGLTLGPHFFEIRIFIAKDERSQKKDEEPVEIKEEAGKDKSEQPETENGDNSTENDSKYDGQSKNSMEVDGPNQTKSNTLESDQKHPEPASKPTTPDPSEENSLAEVSNIEDTNSQTPKNASSSPAPQLSSAVTTQIEDSQITKQSSNPSGQSKSEKPKKDKDPTDALSAENTLMVFNLNALAKVDINLHRLMKIVATGSANPNQLMTFQGYILRAREMGSPPHPFLVPNFRLDPHTPLRIRKPSKEKGTKYLKLSKQTAKEQKLTAFQEKYISDATLVFEFVENSNVRYMLPKNSICEILPSKKSSDDRDLLISFLWIHNQTEVDRYETLLEEYETAVQEREKKEREELQRQVAEEERQKQIAEGKIVEDPPEPEPELPRSRRRPPPRRGAKKQINKPPKKLVAPEEPEPRYTAVSFVIHDISTKFVSILLNSMKPEAEVRSYMKRILDRGSRSASLHLWYQVDGKLDEALAENIRVEISNEEKKMTGFSTANANAAKKRKL
ncbi:SWR1-complex protein 3 [Yamadazyma tenuis]|uniref:SWR1-complex protein 3 n=1 Tax=Candida tenuis (strain ATCC 10573 / BCRC 21748 / CBS 615 / JCM 9827 / NBRC 10315 / NRRL Y-1498 / VKM Y-70) TaxID=590646 RepID=G3B2J6_CANTC|nr:uncharacterized protein CANTEDRAFT_92932 [Yamadazyma tenuis ATCC 10573]EGV64694.1 hypothetical protein CANTEDRAFT_92932 [Yamadazyma tenuis ATCC 10573]WEJ97479.1 SWR1-complex protein 3 [Yamadazyma tenuis]